VRDINCQLAVVIHYDRLRISHVCVQLNQPVHYSHFGFEYTFPVRHNDNVRMFKVQPRQHASLIQLFQRRDDVRARLEPKQIDIIIVPMRMLDYPSFSLLILVCRKPVERKLRIFESLRLVFAELADAKHRGEHVVCVILPIVILRDNVQDHHALGEAFVDLISYVKIRDVPCHGLCVIVYQIARLLEQLEVFH